MSLVVPDGAEEMPEEKVTQLKQAFTVLGSDGSIKPKDLKVFMEALGHECTELELEDMVSACNKAAGAHGDEGGRSGEIGFQAFYTAMLPTLKANPEAQDSGAFKVCLRHLRRLSLSLNPGRRCLLPVAAAFSLVKFSAASTCALDARASVGGDLGGGAAWPALTPVPPTPVPRAQMFDKDGKGFVTVDEMQRKMCSVIPSFPEAEAEATFKETAGGEGKISYADFQKTMGLARAPLEAPNPLGAPKPGEAAA
jgi:Ca2+-binding EF-hand superfamily protein